MQSDESKKLIRNLVIIIGSALVIVLIVVLGIIPLIRGLNRPAFLDILVAPDGATVAIDGQDYGNAVYEFEPGEYQATIKKDGFDEKSFNLELVRGETAKLYTILTPVDDDWSFYEQEKNRTSLENLLGIVESNESTEDIQKAKELAKKVSVKEVLPIDFAICREPASRMTCDSVEVTYDYDEECDNSLCVIIAGRNSELTDEVLNEAKNRLLEKDYDLGNYRFIYKQNTVR